MALTNMLFIARTLKADSIYIQQTDYINIALNDRNTDCQIFQLCSISGKGI